MSEDIYKCKECSKPVLLPKLSQTDYLHGLCYKCLVEAYNKKTNDNESENAPFIDKLKAFLLQNPQPVFFFSEDLRHTKFAELNLSGSLFLNCDLTLSDFQGSDLSKTVFMGSILNNANLSNTTLAESCLLGVTADFTAIGNSNLRKIIAGLDEILISSNFSTIKNKAINEAKFLNLKPCFTNLPDFATQWFEKIWKDIPQKTNNSKCFFSCRESILNGSDLTGAVLIGSNMPGTAFQYTRLQGADFSRAHLEDSSFSHASVGNTRFINAHLDRADMTSLYTPYPMDTSKAEESFVNFEDANLFGATFAGCNFFIAEFKNVNAIRADFRKSSFGPKSVLSGDFTNAQFLYSDFIGCDLGKEGIPINLRDSNFAHAHFIEVELRVSDLDSCIFERCRFDNRDIFNKCENSEGNQSKNIFSTRLKETYEAPRDNTIMGVLKNNKYLTSAALKFEGATIGNILIQNIIFCASDFKNSEIRLIKESNCKFHSSDFDNTVISIPLSKELLETSLEDKNPDNSKANWIFKLCSFHNTFISNIKPDNTSVKRLFFDGCQIISVGFKDFIASQLSFRDCPIEQTPLEQLQKNSGDLGELVLINCKLKDGQYFGYLSNPNDRWKAEKDVFKTIHNIVIGTEEYASRYLRTNDQNQTFDKEKQQGTESWAGRQYLWNMFAKNFRNLALPKLESKCLARLKNVDLFASKEPGVNSDNRLWSKAASQIYIVFLGSLLVTSISSGIIINEFEIFDDLLMSGIAIFFLLSCFGLSFYVTLLWGKESIENHSHKIVTKIAYTLYYYGESVRHALISWFLVIFTFTLVYSLSGVLNSQFHILSNHVSIFINDNWSHGFVNSAYFSIVTFTTLGFGDLHPLGLAKLFAAMEACIGAVMMALFVFSFSRRTAAR